MWRSNWFRLGIYTNSITYGCRIVYTMKRFDSVVMPFEYSVYAMVCDLYGLFIYIPQSDSTDVTVIRKLGIRCAIIDRSSIILIIINYDYCLISCWSRFSYDFVWSYVVVVVGGFLCVFVLLEPFFCVVVFCVEVLTVVWTETLLYFSEVRHLFLPIYAISMVLCYFFLYYHSDWYW